MEFIQEIRVSDVIDMVVASLLIYVLLVLFKQTRSAFVLLGMVMVGVLYLAARVFNLLLTIAMLQGFFAALLILIIVIFRDEIRHFFERVASRGFHGMIARGKGVEGDRTPLEIIVRTLCEFGENRIGALIVLPGKLSLDGVLDGGTRVDGLVSEPLLHSIFDVHSVGHDGAAVIQNGRITIIGTHLPLSKDHKKLRRHGTRHAAALGLSEVTDALCLVVSEEKGTISIARDGQLRGGLNRTQLLKATEEFFAESAPPIIERRQLRSLVRHNFREKLVAIVLSIGLWLLFVHQARTEYRTFSVPVEIDHVPTGMQLAQVSPPTVDVTLGGPRRAYYFFRENQIHLSVPALNALAGWTSRTVTPTDVSLPSGLLLRDIEPKEVRIRLETNATATNKPGN